MLARPAVGVHVLWVLLMLDTANARDELVFAPDRPGVGDSTSPPGRGRALAQLGILGTLSEQGSTVSTSNWTLRVGVDRGVELRLRVPDVQLGDGAASIGTLGVGALVGGNFGGRWSSSVVPEVSFDPSSGAFGITLNGNVAVTLGEVALWTHGSAGFTDVGTLLAGGGASWSPGKVGTFVNGWYVFGDAAYAGVGGWWTVAPRIQLDAGLDVGFLADGPTWLPGLGVSAGF